MKLIAFGGSNSKQSINRKLAAYAASLFENYEVEVLDLNDFSLPLFSVDVEKEIGSPKNVERFMAKIAEADFIVLSLAENNSSFNVGFKNLFDWISRRNRKVFGDKPMLLMATSDGKRGGANVLEFAEKAFPRYGAVIEGVYSLPSFNENFKEGEGIINPELNLKLKDLIQTIQSKKQ